MWMNTATAYTDDLVTGLKALGDPSRLRLVAALDVVELTVSELCTVIGQSQPRTSRHLKLLVDAGVLDRQTEGTSVFYRLAGEGHGRGLVDAALSMLDHDDPTIQRDRQRLDEVRSARREQASNYFEANARDWDRVRGLHVDEDEVERAVLTAARIDPQAPIGRILDIGTGTGRMLEVFAPHVEEGVGIDDSRQMLHVARSRLDEAGHRNCRVRHGDVYDLDLEPGSFDVAILHHVLHFLDDPESAIQQVARTLRTGGRLVLVDFAPHSRDELRTDFAHRRLGFTDTDVAAWFEAADLESDGITRLDRDGVGPDGLTTVLWSAVRWPSLASPLQPVRAARARLNRSTSHREDVA